MSSSDNADSDSVTCTAHAQETNDALANIQSCVAEAKEVLGEVEGFSHPCGGPGWRLAVFLDMDDIRAQCPNVWMRQMVSRTPVCMSTSFSACGTAATFQISEPYNQVCGRVHAFAFGAAGGFGQYYSSGGDVTIGVDEFVSSGVIITRSNNEHVFSFIAGSTAFNSFGSPTPATERCPCFEGEDEFEVTNGPLPNYLNGDYFCETAQPSSTVGLEPPALLWDGFTCAEGSQCCDSDTLPYFTKVLGTATNDPLEINICQRTEPISVRFLEVYVK